MKQLSSLDAEFLAFENARQPGHVAGLAVHDPSTAPDGRLTAASMMELLHERMHLLRHRAGQRANVGARAAGLAALSGADAAVAGDLDVGIIVDREQMPDVWRLLDDLDLSLTELEDAAPRGRRGRR